jgi:hypothetical protein
VLAEFGDDPDRYVDAKARKNYSGMSPITKASGTKRVVLARFPADNTCFSPTGVPASSAASRRSDVRVAVLAALA